MMMNMMIHSIFNARLLLISRNDNSYLRITLFKYAITDESDNGRIERRRAKR